MPMPNDMTPEQVAAIIVALLKAHDDRGAFLLHQTSAQALTGNSISAATLVSVAKQLGESTSKTDAALRGYECVGDDDEDSSSSFGDMLSEYGGKAADMALELAKNPAVQKMAAGAVGSVIPGAKKYVDATLAAANGDTGPALNLGTDLIAKGAKELGVNIPPSALAAFKGMAGPALNKALQDYGVIQPVTAAKLTGNLSKMPAAQAQSTMAAAAKIEPSALDKASTNLAAMTPAQTAATTGALAKLPTEQQKVLAQIISVIPAQKAAQITPALALLPADKLAQIAAMPTDKIAALTPPQVAAFGKPAVAAPVAKPRTELAALEVEAKAKAASRPPVPAAAPLARAKAAAAVEKKAAQKAAIDDANSFSAFADVDAEARATTPPGEAPVYVVEPIEPTEDYEPRTYEEEIEAMAQVEGDFLTAGDILVQNEMLGDIAGMQDEIGAIWPWLADFAITLPGIVASAAAGRAAGEWARRHFGG